CHVAAERLLQEQVGERDAERLGEFLDGLERGRGLAGLHLADVRLGEPALPGEILDDEPTPDSELAHPAPNVHRSPRTVLWLAVPSETVTRPLDRPDLRV